jgi:hypothetical protein
MVRQDVLNAARVRLQEQGKGSRGAALALVVVALFVLGGLASTAFVLSFAEQRVGRRFVRFFQASAAADAGVYAPLSGWDVSTYNRLEISGSAFFAGENADGTGSFEGSVTRLGARLFLVTSEGRSADNGVRQRAGALYRLRPLLLTVNAALDIRGPLDMEETVRISGIDKRPYGWNCGPTTQPLPALRSPAPDSGTAPWSGCEASRCLEGEPLFESVPGGYGSGGVDLGGSTLSDLRAIAVHVLPGGDLRVQADESNGICVTSNPNNWGDPFNSGGACGDHFPAVYSEGDLQVYGGQGQGVLVVEGDLTVSGGFRYFGIVIVLGKFLSVGSGSQITGAMIVRNDRFGLQSLAGMTIIQYASCAVDRSLAGSGRGVLLHERSWLDMY